MVSAMRAACLGVVIAGLAGCLPGEEGGVTKGEGDRTPSGCVEGMFADLVGQPAAAAAVVPEPKRIIRPGQPVTRDYIPSRTNVMLDENGVITRVYCG